MDKQMNKWINGFKRIFRCIKLYLIDTLLGDEIEPDQQKWLAKEYKKVLDWLDNNAK